MTKKPEAPSSSTPSSAPSRPLSQMVESPSKRVKVDEDNYDRFAKRTQVPARTLAGAAPPPAAPAAQVVPQPSRTSSVTEPLMPRSATAESSALLAARAELAAFAVDDQPLEPIAEAAAAPVQSRVSASIAALEPELGPSGLQPPPPELPGQAPVTAAPSLAAGTQVLVGFSAPGLAVPPVDPADLATPGGTLMLAGFSAPGIAVPPIADPSSAPSQGTQGGGRRT